MSAEELAPKPQVPAPTLSLAERLASYAEVELGYTRRAGHGRGAALPGLRAVQRVPGLRKGLQAGRGRSTTSTRPLPSWTSARSSMPAIPT